MTTKIVEVTDATEFNWGKFLIGRFDEVELSRTSKLPVNMGDELNALHASMPLLHGRGWDRSYHTILDLQTGEGTILRLPNNGLVSADLEKHAIWVCPMYQPFLEWAYQNFTTLEECPEFLKLGNVPTALAGYRRPRKKA